jgi:polysaccharide biosynthesis transport protein
MVPARSPSYLTPASPGVNQFPAQLANALRRSWWLVLGLSALAAAAAGFYSVGQTKIYLATVIVQIDPTAPRPLGPDVQGVADLGAGLYWDTQQYYQTQYEVLRSRHLAERTVRRLGLERDAGFIRNSSPNVSLPPLTEPDVESAIDALRGRMTVTPIKESRLVSITLQDADPARAARVLRAVAETYIDDNVDGSLESTESASRWLNVQLEKLKAELTDREQALHDYKRNKEILSVSMDDQNEFLRVELGHLSQALTNVQTERESLASRYEELSAIDLTSTNRLPSRELLESNLLNQLRSSYVDAERQRQSLTSKGYGANHPDVLAQLANVELSKNALLDEIRNIKEALGAALAAKKQEEQGLRSLYDRAKARALDLNGLTLEYRRLERAKNNTEKLYSLVLERTKESDLTRFMRFNNIRVVDQAITSPSPIRPRVPLNTAIGAVLGFGLGMLGAFGRTLLDRTFRTVQDLEATLQLPVLAVLPRMLKSSRSLKNRRDKAERAELLVHEKPTSSTAEAARALRTNLMFTAPDKPQRRLLITSGGPLEGKTTVACWIATALAQTGQRVLLVDCDLRRPRVHRVFDRVNDSGVTTLLLDSSDFEKLDLSSTVPNLDVLTSGPPAPNPAELLQSERFAQLLTKLEQRYDRIVIDSPPVAAVTDATILSTLVDSTLLIVRAHATSRELAAQVARVLRDISPNMVGVVFNAIPLQAGKYGGYHYQQYYQREETARS